MLITIDEMLSKTLLLSILELILISVTPTGEEIEESCWPDQPFVFVKPNTGCPDSPTCGDERRFQEGAILFNTEDTSNRNNASPNLHISGFVHNSSIRLEICSRAITRNNNTWPPGCYCLFARNCRKPFTVGSATWHAEQSSQESAITTEGSQDILPDGAYNSNNMTIQFCCRCDKAPTSPIVLPTYQPFYLMTYFTAGNSCQVVEGMDVQPEYIQWHTDNSENSNTFTIPVPTGVSNTPDPYIVFCYYSPSTNRSVPATASPDPSSTSNSLIPAEIVIPVVVTLCTAAVVLTVLIITLGVVCKRKRRRSKKWTYSETSTPPPLPPDDRGYYSEITSSLHLHNPLTVFTNPGASYPIPVDRRYSTDPITTRNQSPLSRALSQDQEEYKCPESASTSGQLVKSFPITEHYDVESDSDDDCTLEFDLPLPTEFALNEFIGRMKHPVSIPAGDIITGELIGSGNFGMVYKAVWKKGQEDVDVAVKMQNDEVKENDKVRFLQEGAIMGQFKHPNIVNLLGIVLAQSGDNDSKSCKMIVMEFLSNGTLHNYLPNILNGCSQVQASERLVSFSREIASGMEYLTSKKFVHRDLAARNILLNDQYVCKIADFGMARDVDDIYYYKSHGGMVPVKWTAPEALAYGKYSTSSDVWSYGCVLYEIWSLGEKPLDGLSVHEIYSKLLNGYRQAPPPGCPRCVYNVMIDCWNPEPARRPAFKAICSILKQPKECVLQWSCDDQNTYENAATLGADLEVGKLLYTDLQNAYGKYN